MLTSAPAKTNWLAFSSACVVFTAINATLLVYATAHLDSPRPVILQWLFWALLTGSVFIAAIFYSVQRCSMSPWEAWVFVTANWIILLLLAGFLRLAIENEYKWLEKLLEYSNAAPYVVIALFFAVLLGNWALVKWAFKRFRPAP